MHHRALLEDSLVLSLSTALTSDAHESGQMKGLNHLS